MAYHYESVKLEKGMYGRSGHTFAQTLEELDPSEHYRGTPLEGMDAFQRQLKRFDIKVKGAGSDMVEKFFHTTESAVLFPEFVSRVVRQGLEEESILPAITATVTNFDGMDYRSIASIPTEEEKSLKRVEEGAQIPQTTVRTQENLVRLHKRGRMLVASYEAIRFQRLDLFSVTLRQIGGHIARMQVEDAIAVVMDGDGNDNAAQSCTVGTDPISGTKGTLDYGALLDFWGQFDPYTMNTLLVGGDTMLQLLDADGKEIDESSDQFVAHYWHFDFPRNSVHIRKKPHDFFLHLGGKTVYTSITQILIRKSLFEKTGPFPVNFGRSADFQWGMRAALNTDVIYLPQQLASWRIHSEQTTASRNPQEINSNFALMLKMAEQCIEEWNDPEQQKRSRWLVRLMYFKAKLLPAKQNSNRWFLLLRCVLQTILSNPLMLAEFTLRSLRFYGKGKRKLWLIRTYDSMILARVHRLKLSHLIVPVEADTLRRGGGKP